MLRIAGVIRESIVDGPGLRFVLFTQGCTHNCEGCHNPATHALDGGYEIEAERVLTEFFKNPLLKGITLSGGEPFLQARDLIPIAKAVREGKKDVVIYTGYTLEALRAMNNADVNELLENCDVLVDGAYIEELKDIRLKFRGSANQRVIDVQKTLEKGECVLYLE